MQFRQWQFVNWYAFYCSLLLDACLILSLLSLDNGFALTKLMMTQLSDVMLRLDWEMGQLNNVVYLLVAGYQINISVKCITVRAICSGSLIIWIMLVWLEYHKNYFVFIYIYHRNFYLFCVLKIDDAWILIPDSHTLCNAFLRLVLG